MKSAAIITAAGSGTRMGAGKNKILLPLKGKTVIELAVKPFENPQKFKKIIITYSNDDLEILKKIFKNSLVPVDFVAGGSTRQESVLKGLKHLKGDNPKYVLIHDGARPWITENQVELILDKTEEKGCAVPVTPSVNAMKKINRSGEITEHLERGFTVSAQTPQGFNYIKILEAHIKASEEEFTAVDDTELWDRYFNRVSTVDGDISNIKITYKKDLKN